jgi:hypothetical protein
MATPRVWIGGWRHVEHLDPTKSHTGTDLLEVYFFIRLMEILIRCIQIKSHRLTDKVHESNNLL